MATLSGMRRRGVPPEAIRDFCERVGVAKFKGVIDMALLEHCIRDELNRTAPRVMAVLRPLRVVIENYPEGPVEELDAVNNPEDSTMGMRRVPFSRVLYIEQDDFREEPPPKYFRLAPGREVRLRYAYFITCQSVVKDPKTGQVVELRCTYDPATRGGDAPDSRKVKATLHWVCAAQAVPAEVRLYEHLFTKEDPNEIDNPSEADPSRDRKGADPSHEGTEASRLTSGHEGTKDEIRSPQSAVRNLVDWKCNINPNSLEVLTSCQVEPSLTAAAHGARYQFERHGYFCVDSKHSRPGHLVFNRTVTLKDTWAKIEKKL